MTAEEIEERLDRGEPLTLLDVRNPRAWSKPDVKLPGAILVPIEDVEKRCGELPRDRAIITYCT